MEGQIKIDECVVDKSISKIQIEYESIWFGFYYVYEITKKNIELINMKCHDLKHYVFAVGDVDEKNMVDICDSAYKTGNEALDIVLMEKSLICKHENINYIEGKNADSNATQEE